MKKLLDTHFLLRLPIGVSFFGHGLVRIPKLSAFANNMVADFTNSWLPDVLVLSFGYALPLIELLIGVFIIAGWYYRQTLAAGILTISVLLFGSSTIENWNAFTPQLIHALYFGLLLFWEDQREKLIP